MSNKTTSSTAVRSLLRVCFLCVVRLWRRTRVRLAFVVPLLCQLAVGLAGHPPPPSPPHHHPSSFIYIFYISVLSPSPVFGCAARFGHSRRARCYKSIAATPALTLPAPMLQAQLPDDPSSSRIHMKWHTAVGKLGWIKLYYAFITWEGVRGRLD